MAMVYDRSPGMHLNDDCCTAMDVFHKALQSQSGSQQTVMVSPQCPTAAEIRRRIFPMRLLTRLRHLGALVSPKLAVRLAAADHFLAVGVQRVVDDRLGREDRVVLL